MLPEVVNCEGFCKAIGKHVGTTNPLDREFILRHQLSNIMMLNINVLGTGLALHILGKDNACFVVTA